MKYLLLITSLFISYLGWTCGAPEYHEHHFYYPIFNQELASETQYRGFLYYPHERVNFENQTSNTSDAYLKYQGNINLWTTHFQNWSQEEIVELLFSEHSVELKNNHQSPLDHSIFEYIQFAKSLELTDEYKDPWKYSLYLNNNTVPFSDKIQLGLDKFHSEKNPFLKQRYGYQIIKTLRYNKDYKAAFYFFKHEIENQFEHNEIYYYTIDHIAGCYYNLQQFDKALQLYIKIFTHSKDRHGSAYLSYMFCLNHVNPETILADHDDERLNFYLLKSMSDFNDPFSILESIKAIDVNDERLKIVFARNIAYLDRTIWSKNKTNDNTPDQDHIQKLSTFAKSITNSSKDEFWLYTYAYLQGVLGEYKQAISNLNKISDEDFIDDRNNLILLFNAMQWKLTSDIDESYFENQIEFRNTSIVEYDQYNDYTKSDFIQDYIKDHVLFKLYYQEEKYAEAFLLNNTFKTQISEHALIDILMEFVDKPNKNPLENILMKNAGKNPKNELKYQKANLYLIDGDFENARNEFPESPQAYSIPSMVFSNTLKICYGCPASEIMTDKVYLDPIFSFIPDHMNSKSLTEVLLQLERLSQSRAQRHASLANYLLGNFYNNISNSGYYRGIIWAQSNCCKRDYLRNSAPNAYRQEQTYYTKFANLYYPHTSYYALAKKATHYYEKTLLMATDKEFKAKLIFLIAQSTHNYIDNINIGTIDVYGNETYLQAVFPDSSYYFRHEALVKEMNTTYKDTEFRAEIIKECSYFNLYNQ